MLKSYKITPRQTLTIFLHYFGCTPLVIFR